MNKIIGKKQIIKLYFFFFMVLNKGKSYESNRLFCKFKTSKM